MEYYVQELDGETPTVTPNLGDKKFEEELGKLLQKMTNEGEGKSFLVSWTGASRVPRVEIGGHLIDWTQHGVVYAAGQMVGSYERLKDLDGPEGNENMMLIKIWS